MVEIHSSIKPNGDLKCQYTSSTFEKYFSMLYEEIATELLLIVIFDT